jgi:hypothetical protein
MDEIKYLNAGHAGGVLYDGDETVGFDLVYAKWSLYGGTWAFDPHPIQVEQPKTNIVSHFHEDHWDDFYDACESHHHRFQKVWFDSVHTFGDRSCLIKCEDGFSFYHGNDNIPDLNEIPQAMKTLGIESVDLALIPFEYNGWYPHCSTISKVEKMKELIRLEQKQFDTGIAISKALNAKLSVITGADLVYRGPATLLPRQLSRNQIILKAFDQGVDVKYLNPGDRVTKDLKIIEAKTIDTVSDRLKKVVYYAKTPCQIQVSGFDSKPWVFEAGNLGSYPKYSIYIDGIYCDAFLKGMPFEQIAHARGFQLDLTGDHTPAVWQSILKHL